MPFVVQDGVVYTLKGYGSPKKGEFCVNYNNKVIEYRGNYAGNYAMIVEQASPSESIRLVRPKKKSPSASEDIGFAQEVVNILGPGELTSAHRDKANLSLHFSIAKSLAKIAKRLPSKTELINAIINAPMSEDTAEEALTLAFPPVIQVPDEEANLNAPGEWKDEPNPAPRWRGIRSGFQVQTHTKVPLPAEVEEFQVRTPSPVNFTKRSRDCCGGNPIGFVCSICGCSKVTAFAVQWTCSNHQG